MKCILKLLNMSFHCFQGLIFTDGALWQEQRRFTLRHLRDLGFGKTSIEDQMMDEINDLLSDIKSAAQSDPDHVVDFNDIFTVSIINSLWAILCGKRYQRDDAAFKHLLSLIVQFLRGGSPVGGGVPIPAFLIRLFPSLPKLFGADTELFVPIQAFIRVVGYSNLNTVFGQYIYHYILNERKQLKNTLPLVLKGTRLEISLTSIWTKWRNNHEIIPQHFLAVHTFHLFN